MKIELGSRVVSSDGEAIGTVDRLVLDPEAKTLLEMIVHQGRFLTKDRIIERTLIDDVGVDGLVRLTIKAVEVDNLPQFVQVDYVTPHESWDSVLYPRAGSGMDSGVDYAGLGVSTAFSATTPIVGGAPGEFLGTSQYGSVDFEVRSNLPTNALVVNRRTDVVDSAGKKVGTVEDLTYDDAGAITGLRVRRGLLGRRHGYVPMGAVAGVSPQHVRLSITADEVEEEGATETSPPAQIVVLAFEDVNMADGMLENVRNMEARGILATEDAVVVTVTPSGSAEFRQTRGQTGKFAGRGAGAGFLAGLLLGGPIGGLAVGATVGAVTGALKDSGLDDDFVRNVGSSLQPNSSALFLLVRHADSERVLAELRPFKASVRYTTLPPEQAQQLRQALAREE